MMRKKRNKLLRQAKQKNRNQLTTYQTTMAKKVLPTKLEPTLIDELQQAALATGVSRNNLIELILTDGVAEIKRKIKNGEQIQFRIQTKNTVDGGTIEPTE